MSDFPNPPKDYSQAWAAEFKRQVEDLAAKAFKKDQDIEIGDTSVIIKSPNGTRFRVSTDDQGNLATYLIVEDQPPPPPPPPGPPPPPPPPNQPPPPPGPPPPPPPPPPPNSPPTQVVPGAQAVVIGQTLVFGTTRLVTVYDAEDPTLATTVSVSAGTVTLTTGGGGTITTNDTASARVTGTAAQINAALLNMVYTPPSTEQGVVMTVTTQDTAVPPLSDSDTIAITVTAVAQPPAQPPYYPFGSRKDLVNGTYPYGGVVNHKTQAEMDQSIRSKYNAWKNRLIVDDPRTPGGKAVYFGDFSFDYTDFLTVSEGMGYGMLLAVFLADQPLFDALLKTVRNHPAQSVINAGQPLGRYLMDWKLWADGTSDGERYRGTERRVAGGGWNAMDGDQDIAEALLLADRQWGTTGTTWNYLEEGKNTIRAMRAWNMKNDGTTMGLATPSVSRTSDYMIGHEWDYAAAMGGAEEVFWGTTAIDRQVSLIEHMQFNYSSVQAIVPDFIVNTNGELDGQWHPLYGRPYSGPMPSPGGMGDWVDTEHHYFANAQRCPTRYAQGLVYRQHPRWYAATERLNNYIKNHARGDPNNIQIGYRLDGSGMGTSWPARGMVAGFMNGAQINPSAHQAWLNACWDWCERLFAVQYYDAELTLMAMILASGNWWHRSLGNRSSAPPPPPPPPPAPPPPAPPPSTKPDIAVTRHPDDFLLTGAPNMTSSLQGWFVDDNRWGEGSIVEGGAADQYMQEVGRTLVTDGGPVAFRTRWRWPDVPGTEVKGYPSIVLGKRPGFKSPDHRPGWTKFIKHPDGVADAVDKYGATSRTPTGGTISDLDLAGGGGTPGIQFPIQFPLPGSLVLSFDWAHNQVPTGRGQFVFDIWFTRFNEQSHGFPNAPVTHEIMIPMSYWGNYGAHGGGDGGRNPGWYDHEANGLAGKDWWVYCTKDLGSGDRPGDPPRSWPDIYTGLRYNFAYLDGSWTNPETGQPAIGWKMIAMMPKDAGEAGGGQRQSGSFSIDLVPLLNYLRTRYDVRGVPWMSGNEFLMGVEVGVEPIYGEGDMTVWNIRATRG